MGAEVTELPLKTGTFSLVTIDVACILQPIGFLDVIAFYFSSVYSITHTGGISTNKKP